VLTRFALLSKNGFKILNPDHIKKILNYSRLLNRNALSVVYIDKLFTQKQQNPIRAALFLDTKLRPHNILL